MIWITRSLDLHSDNIITTTTIAFQSLLLPHQCLTRSYIVYKLEMTYYKQLCTHVWAVLTYMSVWSGIGLNGFKFA